MFVAEGTNIANSNILFWDVERLYLYYDEEEGYTVKFSLSSREIPRAEPKGFLKGSGCISQNIPT